MLNLIKYIEMHGNEYIISPSGGLYMVILFGTTTGAVRQLYPVNNFVQLRGLLGY